MDWTQKSTSKQTLVNGFLMKAGRCGPWVWNRSKHNKFCGKRVNWAQVRQIICRQCRQSRMWGRRENTKPTTEQGYPLLIVGSRSYGPIKFHQPLAGWFRVPSTNEFHSKNIQPPKGGVYLSLLSLSHGLKSEVLLVGGWSVFCFFRFVKYSHFCMCFW